MNEVEIPKPLLFEWDKANKTKILTRHKITVEECEEAFLSEDIFIQPDELHSGSEDRYILIGRTKQLRPLFMVFTIRNNSVRVISARNMHRKEINFYEKKARASKIQK
jgi:uncharacterized DUF497 family protein